MASRSWRLDLAPVLMFSSYSIFDGVMIIIRRYRPTKHFCDLRVLLNFFCRYEVFISVLKRADAGLMFEFVLRIKIFKWLHLRNFHMVKDIFDGLKCLCTTLECNRNGLGAYSKPIVLLAFDGANIFLQRQGFHCSITETLGNSKRRRYRRRQKPRHDC